MTYDPILTFRAVGNNGLGIFWIVLIGLVIAIALGVCVHVVIRCYKPKVNLNKNLI